MSYSRIFQNRRSCIQTRLCRFDIHSSPSTLWLASLLFFEPVSRFFFFSSLVCSQDTDVQSLDNRGELSEDWRVPALSAAVVQRVQRSANDTLDSHTAHYGVFVDGRKPDDSTLYNIGSISKPVAHFGSSALLIGLFRSVTTTALAMVTNR